MISQNLEQILNKAIKKANEKKHEFLTLENVLFAMLEDEDVVEVLIDCGANMGDLKKDLSGFLEEDSNFSILTQEEIENLYNLFLYSNFHNAYPLNPDYTVALSLQKLGWGEIVEYNQIEVEPYGIFNQKTKNDSIKYKVSVGNVIWSVLLSETVVVPVILCGWYLWEPKAKLVNTKYTYNEY
jgi:hypothetical protein